MQHYQTPNKRRGTNKKIFILLHHTTSSNFYGTVSWFKNPESQASAHYLIGMNGELGQFEDDNARLWHAGGSRRTTADGNTFYDLNDYSIGIEISNNGEHFTDTQRVNVRNIINNLMQKYGIGPENILRHKDVSGYRGKVDPYDTFRNNEYKTFTDYQNSFLSKPKKMNEDQKQAILKSISNLCSVVYDNIDSIKGEIQTDTLLNSLLYFQKTAKEIKQDILPFLK